MHLRVCVRAAERAISEQSRNTSGHAGMWARVRTSRWMRPRTSRYTRCAGADPLPNFFFVSRCWEFSVAQNTIKNKAKHSRKRKGAQQSARGMCVCVCVCFLKKHRRVKRMGRSSACTSHLQARGSRRGLEDCLRRPWQWHTGACGAVRSVTDAQACL